MLAEIKDTHFRFSTPYPPSPNMKGNPLSIILLPPLPAIPPEQTHPLTPTGRYIKKGLTGPKHAKNEGRTQFFPYSRPSQIPSNSLSSYNFTKKNSPETLNRKTSKSKAKAGYPIAPHTNNLQPHGSVPQNAFPNLLSINRLRKNPMNPPLLHLPRQKRQVS